MENIEWPLDVKEHALDRFNLHHSEGDCEELLLYVQYGEQVSIEMGRTLTGRPIDSPGWSDEDRYVLSPDRRGMFVIHRRWVRTYLRFGQQQQEFAKKHWPIAEAEEVPEQIRGGPVPPCGDTRDELLQITYPILGRWTLAELEIPAVVRMRLGLTKAHQVQTMFAKTVLADPQLYWADSPQKGESLPLVLTPEFGGRPGKPIEVLLVNYGMLRLDLAEPGNTLSKTLTQSGYRLPEDEELYEAEQSAPKLASGGDR